MTTPKSDLTHTKDNFPDEVPIKTRVPWGYRKISKKDKYAVAIPEELQVLSEAFDRKEAGDSYESVIEFIKSKGLSLSVNGFVKLLQKHRGYKPTKRSPKKKPGRDLTPKEKEERKIKLRAAAEKRRITAAKKRLKALEEQKVEKEKADSLPSFAITEPPKKSDREVVFEPNPGPQTEFLAAPEFEVLFGGAAGGGKSYALIADPIRYFENKNFVGLLLRRTNDELRELIWKTKELYPKIYPEAKFSEKASEWRLPSGARLWMSYLDRDEDVLRYQGQAYTWVGFDELTHWPTPYPLDFIRTRVRTADPSLKKMLAIRATTNPGGPGHGWVKKLFVDPSPAGKSFWATDIDTGEKLVHPSTGEPLFKRRFIPATLYDNPYLSEDGAYEANLASLPEKKRKQLLFGDWAVADGAAFEEFSQKHHVIEPFEIPKHWTRFRAMDYGYSSFSAVLWFAIDPQDDQLVVYRELYVSKKTGEAIADIINQIEAENKERLHYGVLDSSVWHKRGEGPSVAEVMISRGCRWRQSDRSAGSRIAGKNRIHELLKIDPTTQRPGIVFFNTCRQIISDLPVIPADPKGTDDIDPRYASDHTYDALRYGVMSRPRTDPFFYQPETYKVSNSAADTAFGY